VYRGLLLTVTTATMVASPFMGAGELKDVERSDEPAWVTRTEIEIGVGGAETGKGGWTSICSSESEWVVHRRRPRLLPISCQRMPGALAEPGRPTEYGRIFPGDDDH